MRRVLLVAALLSAGPSAAQPSQVLEVTGDAVDLRLDGRLYPAIWSPAGTAEDSETFNMPEVGPSGAQAVCLESGNRAVCRTLRVGGKAEIAVRYKGRLIRALFSGRGPAAHFDAAYQTANRGRLRISDPAAYELVNIAIALTRSAAADRGLVIRDTPYAADVERHFGAFREHPFIVAIDRLLAADPASYHPLKMNGVTLVIAPDGTIGRSPVYERVWNGENGLLPLLGAMRDFSARAGFPAFYAAHRTIYEGQAEALRHEVDVERMLAWLAAQFPAVRPYDGIHILFSPLAGHNQSLATFEADGFRELQPHVNFPYSAPALAALRPRGRATYRGLILFTEFNHGFIGPTQAPFEARIAAALRDRRPWTRKGSTTDGYGSPDLLFQEMMNWALVSLYFHDVAPAADRTAMILMVEEAMVSRGFARFPEFNRFLVDLYARRPAGATVASLYPTIVVWFERQALACR